jgi:hypothetical protein
MNHFKTSYTPFNLRLSNYLINFIKQNNFELSNFDKVLNIFFDFRIACLYFVLENDVKVIIDDTVDKNDCFILFSSHQILYDEFEIFVRCDTCLYKNIGLCNKIEPCSEYKKNKKYDLIKERGVED